MKRTGEGGIRTRGTGKPYTGFRNQLLQPLGHLSIAAWAPDRAGVAEDTGPICIPSTGLPVKLLWWGFWERTGVGTDQGAARGAQANGWSCRCGSGGLGGAVVEVKVQVNFVEASKRVKMAFECGAFAA